MGNKASKSTSVLNLGSSLSNNNMRGSNHTEEGKAGLKKNISTTQRSNQNIKKTGILEQQRQTKSTTEKKKPKKKKNQNVTKALIGTPQNFQVSFKKHCVDFLACESSWYKRCDRSWEFSRH